MSFFALVRVLQSTQSREGVLFTMCCWSASRSGGHIGAVIVQFLHEGGNRRTFVSGLVARGQAIESRARFPDLQSMRARSIINSWRLSPRSAIASTLKLDVCRHRAPPWRRNSRDFGLTCMRWILAWGLPKIHPAPRPDLVNEVRHRRSHASENERGCA